MRTVIPFFMTAIVLIGAEEFSAAADSRYPKPEELLQPESVLICPDYRKTAIISADASLAKPPLVSAPKTAAPKREAKKAVAVPQPSTADAPVSWRIINAAPLKAGQSPASNAQPSVPVRSIR